MQVLSEGKIVQREFLESGEYALLYAILAYQNVHRITLLSESRGNL